MGARERLMCGAAIGLLTAKIAAVRPMA